MIGKLRLTFLSPMLGKLHLSFQLSSMRSQHQHQHVILGDFACKSFFGSMLLKAPFHLGLLLSRHMLLTQPEALLFVDHSSICIRPQSRVLSLLLVDERLTPTMEYIRMKS